DPIHFDTDLEARAWFERELANLLACARLAVDQEIRPFAWLLPAVLAGYFRDRGYALQARPLLIGSLRVATASCDHLWRAKAHLGLAGLDQLAGNQTAARSHLDQAMTGYEALDDQLGQANTSMGLGVLDQLGGDYPGAGVRFAAALTRYQALDNQMGQAY